MEAPPLFSLFEGLPRQGPGDDRATRAALDRLGRLPDRPAILDIGCGTGRSTRVLAKATGGTVVALDLHLPFLRTLVSATEPAGPGRVLPVAGSMAALPFAPASFDLIWSEGAIYLIGFAAGLAAWRPLLRPRGRLAVTEITWLTDHPAPAAQAFWGESYPDMATAPANRARAQAAGYRLLDSFVLPDAAWWAEYYDPLAARIAECRVRHGTDPDWAALLDALEREIELRRRHGGDYGYVFYLLERTG